MSNKAHQKDLEYSLKLFKQSFVEKKNLFINFPATYFPKEGLLNIIEAVLIFLDKTQRKSKLSFKVGDSYQDKKEGEAYQVIAVNNSNLVIKKVKTNPKVEQEYTRTIPYKSFTDLFIKLENKEKRFNNQNFLCYQKTLEKLLGYAPPVEYHHKAIVISNKEYFDKICQSLPIARITQNGRIDNPAKIDPAIYFSSDWKTAYKQIIQKERKQIEIVFIFDKVIPTDTLSQIIRDQKSHQFTLSGCISQIKSTEYLKEIMQWNWFKEELEESVNYV